MIRRRHITISGELGSGKSTIARRLVQRYGHKLVSAGDINRSIAASLNLSELEVNLRAEKDGSIDRRVDKTTRDLAKADQPTIFDAHIAWKIVDTAFKVHLLIDPKVAAHRLFESRSSAVERYASVDEAQKALEGRYASERRRYKAQFGVDEARLQNYDLVIDTSDATIGDIMAEIESIYEAEPSTELLLRASARRMLPGYDVATDTVHGQQQEVSRPEVAYCRPSLCFCNGHVAVGRAIERQLPFIAVHLRAEGNEEVEPGVSACTYLNHIKPAWIQAWSQKYGLGLDENLEKKV